MRTVTIDAIERLIRVLKISQEMEVSRHPVRPECESSAGAQGCQTFAESPSGTHSLPIELVSKIFDVRLVPQCSKPVGEQAIALLLEDLFLQRVLRAGKLGRIECGL